jgi:hypothetical protein
MGQSEAMMTEVTIMTPRDFWEELFKMKRMGEQFEAYAELDCDVIGTRYVGYNEPSVDVPMTEGQMVRVTMVSRLGDVGITDDLQDDNVLSYCARIPLHDDARARYGAGATLPSLRHCRIVKKSG